MRFTLVLAVATLATACTVAAMAERPARIVRPSDASRKSLEQAVSAMLHRDAILLAADALQSDSVLIVEPVRLRDPTGNLAQGRETRLPERFRLVKKGSRCLLVHEKSGEHRQLAATSCSAES